MSTETVNVGEAMIAEGDVQEVAMTTKGVAPEVATAEVQAEVPKSPRLPKSSPTLTKEGMKNKKGKQDVTLQLVRASPRKHP